LQLHRAGEVLAHQVAQVALVESYAKAQGLWRTPGERFAFSSTLKLDMAEVKPSLAGPKRPQDRVPLRVSKETYRKHLATMTAERAAKNPSATGKATVTSGGKTFDVVDGAVQVVTNGTQLVAGGAAIVCQLAIGLRSVSDSASLLIAEFAPI
jgi:aconitate hydratase